MDLLIQHKGFNYSCIGYSYFSPGQASHGQDWDAVAYGKPSKDWTVTDCLL